MCKNKANNQHTCNLWLDYSDWETATRLDCKWKRSPALCVMFPDISTMSTARAEPWCSQRSGLGQSSSFPHPNSGAGPGPRPGEAAPALPWQLSHTQTYSGIHTQSAEQPCCALSSQRQGCMQGAAQTSTQRAHQYFSQLIQSPANPCFLRQQIHQILEGSRQLAASEFSEGKNRHWRRLVLVVFPCLTLHIRQAQTLPLQHGGKAVNKSFKSVLPLHTSYLSPSLSKHSSQGFQSLPTIQR